MTFLKGRKIMFKTIKIKSVLLLLLGTFFISGCTALAIGGAAMVAGTGTYVYLNKELKSDYYSSFDKVWAACEKTIAELHGEEVEPYKEIGFGTISAVLHNEEVKITVEYKTTNITTVAIRIGLIGNKPSSQLLHDSIMANIPKEQQ
jgi:hypothetical protein